MNLLIELSTTFRCLIKNTLKLLIYPTAVQSTIKNTLHKSTAEPTSQIIFSTITKRFAIATTVDHVNPKIIHYFIKKIRVSWHPITRIFATLMSPCYRKNTCSSPTLSGLSIYIKSHAQCVSIRVSSSRRTCARERALRQNLVYIYKAARERRASERRTST